MIHIIETMHKHRFYPDHVNPNQVVRSYNKTDALDDFEIHKAKPNIRHLSLILSLRSQN